MSFWSVRTWTLVVGSFLIVPGSPHQVVAGEPGWIPTVIARGVLRQQIESTPIVSRPYRPFHFYGNSVRRLHYRGRALPNRNDVRHSLAALSSRSSARSRIDAAPATQQIVTYGPPAPSIVLDDVPAYRYDRPVLSPSVFVENEPVSTASVANTR